VNKFDYDELREVLTEPLAENHIELFKGLIISNK
jgi:hypothetical protein